MEQLVALAAALLIGPLLYALGRVQGRGDLNHTYQTAHETGWRGGWTAAYREWLTIDRGRGQRAPAPAHVSRNTATALYGQKWVAGEADTVRLHRVA